MEIGFEIIAVRYAAKCEWVTRVDHKKISDGRRDLRSLFISSSFD